MTIDFDLVKTKEELLSFFKEEVETIKSFEEALLLLKDQKLILVNMKRGYENLGEVMHQFYDALKGALRTNPMLSVDLYD